jgi:hypothetical protein
VKPLENVFDEEEAYARLEKYTEAIAKFDRDVTELKKLLTPSPHPLLLRANMEFEVKWLDGDPPSGVNVRYVFDALYQEKLEKALKDEFERVLGILKKWKELYPFYVVQFLLEPREDLPGWCLYKTTI